ncbi:unnamed protein product [Peniophora sp. CBMAI 1063]|nr:unnamed protein product [Peniophora sp. CBMAI 1063]
MPFIASPSGVNYSVPGPTATALARFFAIYSANFHYNPSVSATEEFQRLCEVKGWDKEEDGYWSQAHGTAYHKFKEALVQQFNATYGTDVNSIVSWQALCGAIGVDPVPDTLKECQSNILSSHVNLVDLAEARADGTERRVELFPSEVALSVYTLRTKKIFPKDTAYHTGLLRFLLRHILHPRKEPVARTVRAPKAKRGLSL